MGLVWYMVVYKDSRLGAPYKTNILYVGPSMSFHVNLREGNGAGAKELNELRFGGLYNLNPGPLQSTPKSWNMGLLYMGLGG